MHHRSGCRLGKLPFWSVIVEKAEEIVAASTAASSVTPAQQRHIRAGRGQHQAGVEFAGARAGLQLHHDVTAF